MSPELSNQISAGYFNAITQITLMLPKIFIALVVLLVGSLIARWVSRALTRLTSWVLKHLAKNTPLEHYFGEKSTVQQVLHIVWMVGYWVIMLLVLQTTFSILGLQSLVQVITSVLAYLPRIVSAILVLAIGVGLSGVVESFTKSAIKSVEPQYARALGTLASYCTLIIFTLIAISELGIAQQFILILFVGLIGTLTLALGLGFGLGSKDLISRILENWYDQMKKKE